MLDHLIELVLNLDYMVVWSIVDYCSLGLVGNLVLCMGDMVDLVYKGIGRRVGMEVEVVGTVGYQLD